jgi:hypothetical protein
MSDRTTNHWNEGGRAAGNGLEAEVLIGRVVDGEATPDDRRRFERLATADPLLWRTLAIRQDDARALHEAFREATKRGLRAELPERRLRPTWTLVLSGWAAMLFVATSWALVSIAADRAGGPVAAAPVNQAPAVITPVEHLRAYLDAPYVLGDLEPVIVQVEPLSDGRIAVNFIRRIEEVAFFSPADLPLDESGELIKDPARLRSLEPSVGWPSKEDPSTAPRG